MQGKLVPQNTNDEPAEKLLKQIQHAKVQLIKEGKEKKKKSLPPITKKEIPYNLPNGWVWCKLGEIIELISGRDLETHQFNSESKGIPYITGASAIDGNLININRWTNMPSVVSSINDLLLSCKGTVGKTVKNYIGDCHIARQIMAVRIPFDEVNYEYIRVFLQSYVAQLNIQAKSIIPGISREDVLYSLFPLPPKNEQQRIVEKVNELVKLCDDLETAEKELETLEDYFAEYLSKSILQAAVQGKLVSQDTSDESAVKLLKQIRQEKARLIKEGKKMKEKPLSLITKKEIPYNLPNGWVWCRLGDVCNLYTGNSISDNEKINNYVGHRDGRCYIGTKDVGFDHAINYENGIKIPFGLDEFREAPKDSVLLCIEGGSAGRKIGITDRVICFGNKLCCFIPLLFNKKYLYYYLLSPLLNKFFNQDKKGIIGGVSINLLKKIPLILPPLAEQQRIVTKVNKLMALCDELKKAQEILVKLIPSKVIPFPQQEKDDEELLIAARGNATKGLSAKAQRDVDKLFGNGGNE